MNTQVNTTNTFKQGYNDYICSEEWFKKRKLAFKFHGKSCKKCGIGKRLHVHHMTYVNFRNENIETDLTILCKKCHDKYHSKYKHTSIDTTQIFIYSNPIERIKKLKGKKIKKGIKLIHKPNKERVKKVEALKKLLNHHKIEKWQYFEELRKL